MPKKMERELKAEARKKFPGNKERQDAYVYGTLQRVTSWRPGHAKKGGKRHKASVRSQR